MLRFVNLFLVPCITLWIYYKRAGLTPGWSPKLLLDYGVAAAVNVPAAHVAVFFLRMLLKADIADHTETYCLLAIVTAVVLAFAAELLGKYVKLTCERKQAKQAAEETPQEETRQEEAPL